MQITKVSVEIQVNKDIDRQFLCEFQIDKKTYELQHNNICLQKVIIIERKRNCTYLNFVIGDGEPVCSEAFQGQTVEADDMVLDFF